MTRLRPKHDPPRGLLHAAGVAPSSDAANAHLRFLPPEELAPFVEHFWVVRWRLDAPRSVSTLPHPTIHWTVEGSRSELGGPSRGRFIRTLAGTGRVVAVKFRPAGFGAFCDVPLYQLVGRRVAATRLLGPSVRDVARAIHTLADDEAAALLGERLLALGPRRNPRAQLARDIAEAIARDPELTSVAAVCARFSVAPLALQRLFRSAIGVSPKWVIQRYRLHEALERLARGETSLAAIAHELGFTDQAHFCRVFKSFIGQSPSAFARRVRLPGRPRRSARRERACR